MKKILLTLLAFFCVAAATYLFYLNERILPEKIKDALVKGIGTSTGKTVKIDSAKIDIFRGLVIKGLCLSDTDTDIISAGDANCSFLILPVFRKEIVVTSIKFNQAKILVERMADGSFNIEQFLLKQPLKLFDGKFDLTISKVRITRGDIIFKDSTFEEPFTKELKNADIYIRLLPQGIKFKAEFEIPSKVPVLVKSSGEHSFIKKRFSARVEAKDLPPLEFAAYIDRKKILIPEGRVDLRADVDYSEGALNADADISGIGMKFTSGTVNAELSSSIKVKAKYAFAEKELIYTGSADVKNLALYDIGMVDKIRDIRGEAVFSDKNFHFKNITATVFGLPVKASASIEDMSKGALDIEVASSCVDLGTIEDIMRNNIKADIPAHMQGSGDLAMKIRYNLPSDPSPAFAGHLDFKEAIFTPGYGNSIIEQASGSFKFTQNQLMWNRVSLKYGPSFYTTSGTVTNFKNPGVQVELNSKDLKAKLLFSVNDRLITLSAAEGSYGDYAFSLQGSVDSTDAKNPAADINGTVRFELADNKEPLKSFKDKFKDIKISGKFTAQFQARSRLNDIFKSDVDVRLKSEKLLLNNFLMEDFKLDASRRADISNIKYIRALFCGGVLEGNGLVEDRNGDLSYQLNADLKNIKLEELKKNTTFKDKDVSGLIQAHVGMKGVCADKPEFSSWGKVNISKGRLWEINMFKGLGALLFRSDYSSVLFEEGSCSFSVKDKVFFTNDLTLKSSLLNLYGAVKITSGRDVMASLKAEFTDEGVDAARTGGVAGAIERYCVIEVIGPLDEPKYKIRPDLSNVVADIADSFFSQ